MPESIVNAAVPIKLDGRTFELRFSAFAFIRYAEVAKRDLMKDIKTLGVLFSTLDNPDTETPMAELFGRLSDILWAGLIDRAPDLAREEVPHFFTMPDIPDIMGLIMNAFRLTVPEVPLKARPTKAPKRANGTLTDGSGSTQGSETAPVSVPPSLAS